MTWNLIVAVCVCACAGVFDNVLAVVPLYYTLIYVQAGLTHAYVLIRRWLKITQWKTFEEEYIYTIWRKRRKGENHLSLWFFSFFFYNAIERERENTPIERWIGVCNARARGGQEEREIGFCVVNDSLFLVVEVGNREYSEKHAAGMNKSHLTRALQFSHSLHNFTRVAATLYKSYAHTYTI